MAARNIETIHGHKLEKVFLSVEDHIAVMTLHNPPVNAADGVVQEEILLLCDYINHEDDIWVCIMHSDIKTFCVGVDIKRFYNSILEKDGQLWIFYHGRDRDVHSPQEDCRCMRAYRLMVNGDRLWVDVRDALE